MWKHYNSWFFSFFKNNRLWNFKFDWWITNCESLIQILNKILTGFGDGLYTGIILNDQQKAFDTTNHKILLGKLLPTGFSNNTISWNESYLPEHHFTVKVANQVSKFPSISCGFLQGSILGPLLFLIYVNGMSQAVESKL